MDYNKDNKKRKKIKFNGVFYDIPSEWCHVSLATQIKVAAKDKENSELKVSKGQGLRYLDTVSIYTGINIKELKKAKLHQVTALLKKLEFINIPLPKESISEFSHNGITYSAEDTLLNAQFQDFISLESVIADNKDNLTAAIPKIIAILAKKEYETLDDYDLQERSEEFLDLDIVTATKFSNFFLQTGTKYVTGTKLYLEKEGKEELKKAARAKMLSIRNIQKEQAGQGLLSTLRKGILSNWSTSLEKIIDSY